MVESVSTESQRDPITDPRKGDYLGFQDRPDKSVTMRFTDATGQECLWVATTRVVKLKNWTRSVRGARILKRGDE